MYDKQGIGRVWKVAASAKHAACLHIIQNLLLAILPSRSLCLHLLRENDTKISHSPPLHLSDGVVYTLQPRPFFSFFSLHEMSNGRNREQILIYYMAGWLIVVGDGGETAVKERRV